MEKILVLGIGNQLMMDDGIGVYLVRELSNDLTHINCIVGESDIDYCTEQIEEATFVIIIDAVMMGKKPGDISVLSLSELTKEQPLNISPHNLHLFHVLYLQKETVKGYLIGVEPYEIGFQIGLSEPLQKSFREILNNVKKKIFDLTESRA